MTPSLADRLDELEILAKAATPGPWHHQFFIGRPHTTDTNSVIDDKDREVVFWTGFDHDMSKKENKANAKFIAAANPSAVLALIEAIRAEMKDREWRPLAEHDGTYIPVLVAVHKRADGQRIVGEAWFSTDEGAWWWANTNDGDYGVDHIEDDFDILGWKELPKAPQP